MKTKIFSMLVLAMLTLTACGGGAVDGDDVADAPTKDAPAVIADAPEGCPSSTNLTVESKEVSKFTAVSSYYTTWSTQLDKPDIIFANYEGLDPKDKYGRDKTGNDALIVIRPKHVDGTALSVGTFTKVKDANQALGEVNISTENLAGGVFDKEGSVEITYIGDKYVCGSVKADDGRSKVMGEFIAEKVAL